MATRHLGARLTGAVLTFNLETRLLDLVMSSASESVRVYGQYGILKGRPHQGNLELR